MNHQLSTNTKLYTISEVAEKLNLSTKTLRRWEADGKFQASRTIGGQRRYTLEDLQILDAIKHGTIPSKSDLLTLQQAANLFGVTPQTIIRWENEGKIHPFITSGNTYYPKSRLVTKIEQLKNTSQPFQVKTDQPMIETINHQPTPHTTQPSTPTTNLTNQVHAQNQPHHPNTTHPSIQTKPNLENQTNQNKTHNLIPQSPSNSSDFKTTPLIIAINFFLSLFLILGYHLLLNNSTTPINPPTTTTTTPTQTPLQKTLQSILSLTGDFNTPGSITTKTNLTVGKTLNLLPTTPPLKPTPGTLYYDATSQTLKFFTQNKWLEFPNPKLLLPNQTQLISNQGLLPKGKTQVTIQNPHITPKTNIIVTFNSNYSPAKKYWLTQKTGQFTLHTDFPPANNSTFIYLLIYPQP